MIFLVVVYILNYYVVLKIIIDNYINYERYVRL